MTKTMLILLIIGYLGILFFLAFRAENRYKEKAATSPLIYVLGLAVYCTAWTYYGSVGVASTEGLNFMTIYLGPVIAIPLWIVILRKVIAISKVNNISSIADFISLRYGNSRGLGMLITIIYAIAIIPYISLQLKAVSESFAIVTHEDQVSHSLFKDSAFYLSLLLAVFTSIYGTRSSDTTDNRTGILFTVAFESALKLIVFLIVGVYVTFYLFDGTTDIYNQISQKADLSGHFMLNDLSNGMNWSFMIILSFMMIFLLPRQFQVTVVEYSRKVQMKHAIWAFPLYLLLFNVFVIFIAWGGMLRLPATVNPDYYSLLIPLYAGDTFMAVLVFFGGLSAAISMIVISSLALSTMISNNLIIPFWTMDALDQNNSERNNRLIKNIRRASIFSLIIIAYVLFVSIKNEQSLFSIGLLSFIIMSQVAPSFFIGLYWNRGSSVGAKAGIIAGFIVTGLIYIIPFLSVSIWNDSSLIEHGYFGNTLLRPYNLFGISDMTPVTSAMFWSLFVNTGLYLSLSVIVKGNYRERNYGEIYANNTAYSDLQESAFIWEGEAYIEDIRNILVRFIGVKRTNDEIDKFRMKYNIAPDQKYADSRFINYSEKLLSGIIGNVSAKTVIANVIQERPVSLIEVLNVLEENKQAIATNKILIKKSKELQELTDRLTQANDKLQELDRKKDSFLNTVAHELKTPITSIRVSSDVLEDEEMPMEIRTEFLNNIKTDTERLSELISNILNLEKLSSGREKVARTHDRIDETLREAIMGITMIAQEKGVRLITDIHGEMIFPHDKTKFYQVFTNILTNALKYIPEEQGYILAKAKSNASHHTIEISDNGSGIDEADIPYIFDKFYQSQNQDLIKPVGSGFGLAIVKTVVEMHNGQVWAANNNDVGARFTIKLPITP